VEAAAAQSESASEVRARGLTPLWACAAVAFLLVSVVVGVLEGPVDLGVGDVLESAAAKLGLVSESPLTETEEAILWEIRVPRVVLGGIVGGMLALAGATYQGVFRNPLADPYLLGVAAGAGLGATVAIAYLPEGLSGQRVLPVAAFVGGIAAVFLTYAVGRSARRERDAATLVLAGVTVAAFFTAWQTRCAGSWTCSHSGTTRPRASACACSACGSRSWSPRRSGRPQSSP
jgi:iron complex transport system permease protein